MKIISGAQSGADIAGLVAAKKLGIPTGGTMPKGFKTLEGPQPEYAKMFGVQEHSSSSYAPRTYQNVKESDATLRLAYDFLSPGEICTLKAIKEYNKLHLDINLSEPPDAKDVAKWIIENKISTLNIAGNSEQTCPGIYKTVRDYLIEVLTYIKEDNVHSNF